jgi:hypothetical protein
MTMRVPIRLNSASDILWYRWCALIELRLGTALRTRECRAQNDVRVTVVSIISADLFKRITN